MSILDLETVAHAGVHLALTDGDRDLVGAAPAASQRAAIRVPLPDSSAVEPSGFQMTISARGPAASDHLEDAVRADPKW
jgi:hypothetical protein